ncbi:hypothetical protein SKAU_G00273060 [Synaphobranchus kaupii]|uniref:Uncharacterized protein n=1 Tax=Synaphobranchus kaupii TaxID=118154 RepID=A0A9Q1F0N5_SYNKA|nr:hypothetical protein SKAU_G00273060 [Synaphobranchus kaupii]
MSRCGNTHSKDSAKPLSDLTNPKLRLPPWRADPEHPAMASDGTGPLNPEPAAGRHGREETSAAHWLTELAVPSERVCFNNRPSELVSCRKWPRSHQQLKSCWDTPRSAEKSVVCNGNGNGNDGGGWKPISGAVRSDRLIAPKERTHAGRASVRNGARYNATHLNILTRSLNLVTLWDISAPRDFANAQCNRLQGNQLPGCRGIITKRGRWSARGGGQNYSLK